MLDDNRIIGQIERKKRHNGFLAHLKIDFCMVENGADRLYSALSTRYIFDKAVENQLTQSKWIFWTAILEEINGMRKSFRLIYSFVIQKLWNCAINSKTLMNFSYICVCLCIHVWCLYIPYKNEIGKYFQEYYFKNELPIWAELT